VVDGGNLKCITIVKMTKAAIVTEVLGLLMVMFITLIQTFAVAAFHISICWFELCGLAGPALAALYGSGLVKPASALA
jgi:hypothetical protein